MSTQFYPPERGVRAIARQMLTWMHILHLITKLPLVTDVDKHRGPLGPFVLLHSPAPRAGQQQGSKIYMYNLKIWLSSVEIIFIILI
jgi:hypothetical protein